MSLSLMLPEGAADAERRRRLRRMRTLAVGLLVFAALVYLVTLDRGGFWGYVNAGAEASMVGAIADWFAVTALFRHPLGLPVPHTALIPKRKDEFGRSLEDFVQENFLQEAVIRDRLQVAQVSARAADWLREPANARKVVAEGSSLLITALGRVRDRDVGAAVALTTSVRVVIANPATMALWGVIVAALLLIGSLPFFLGLTVVMPILGHATWHLYRKLVEPASVIRGQ